MKGRKSKQVIAPFALILVALAIIGLVWFALHRAPQYSPDLLKINVDFGVASTTKSGGAAIGQEGEFWNSIILNSYTGGPSEFLFANIRSFSGMSLQTTLEFVGLDRPGQIVANVGDTMYQTFSYGAQDSTGIVRFHELPAGTYTVLVYGHGYDGQTIDYQGEGGGSVSEDIPGKYHVVVNGRDYGTKQTTKDYVLGRSATPWVEDRQYVRFTNILVRADEELTLEVLSPETLAVNPTNGVVAEQHRVPVINGLQLVQTSTYFEQIFSLQPGNNYLTLGLEPQTTDMNAFFTELPLNTPVYLYVGNGSATSYVLYTKRTAGFSPALPVFSAGQRFVLRLVAPATFTLKGSLLQASVPLTLNSGDSLIGIPYCSSDYQYTASKVLAELASLGKDCSSIALLNTTNGATTYYVNGTGTDFALSKERAYFVQCALSAPFTWTPSCLPLPPSLSTNVTNTTASSAVTVSYTIEPGNNYLTLGVAPTTTNMTAFFAGMPSTGTHQFYVYDAVRGTYVGASYLGSLHRFTGAGLAPLVPGQGFVIQNKETTAFTLNLTGRALTSPVPLVLNDSFTYIGIPYCPGSYQYTASKVLGELNSLGKSCYTLYKGNASSLYAQSYASSGAGTDFTLDSKTSYFLDCDLAGTYTWTPSCSYVAPTTPAPETPQNTGGGSRNRPRHLPDSPAGTPVDTTPTGTNTNTGVQPSSSSQGSGVTGVSTTLANARDALASWPLWVLIGALVVAIILVGITIWYFARKPTSTPQYALN